MNRFEKVTAIAVAICCSTPAWAKVIAAPGPETDISIGAVMLLVAGYVWMRRKAKLSFA